ncbi:hypothetical protein ACFQT0_19635 [Hymenobacter humi]|uniref:Uncharacterized protein n=1 Tax=Hymenobacter humi TaxID=1411620 RepID=A0ABW2UA41_9BACT
MKATSTPALTLPQFNAANINLATLGLNPANPAEDRVSDALAPCAAASPSRPPKAR